MSDLSELKQTLRLAINNANEDGTYSDEAYSQVKAAIEALVPHSPIMRPHDEQEKISAAWSTLFAQFGPRHTAGKPVVHEGKLNFVSFSAFPALPFRNLELEQEIHHVSKDYNNVHVIEPIDGSTKLRLATFGRYSVTADEPQRYHVNFYKTKIWSEMGLSDAEIRTALGMPEGTPLEVEIKSPKLHSDIVYCDEDIRINFGSVGGIYVLARLHHDGATVNYS